MMKPKCDFLNQNPKRPKSPNQNTAEASCQKRGQARWCFCASATASATCASPPSSPWRRPSNLLNPCRAPILRVRLPNSETPTSFLLHLLPLPRPHFSALSLFSLLSPAPLAGSAPKRFRAMATDVAAAADPPASRGCPAMKAEFAKHAEYLNALVRRPFVRRSSAFVLSEAFASRFFFLVVPRDALKE